MKSFIAIFFFLLLSFGIAVPFTDGRDNGTTCMEAGEQKEKSGKDAAFETESAPYGQPAAPFVRSKEKQCPANPSSALFTAPVLDKQTPPPDPSC